VDLEDGALPVQGDNADEMVLAGRKPTKKFMSRGASEVLMAERLLAA
jgi:hypothetical protein